MERLRPLEQDDEDVSTCPLRVRGSRSYKHSIPCHRRWSRVRRRYASGLRRTTSDDHFLIVRLGRIRRLSPRAFPQALFPIVSTSRVMACRRRRHGPRWPGNRQPACDVNAGATRAPFRQLERPRQRADGLGLRAARRAFFSARQRRSHRSVAEASGALRNEHVADDGLQRRRRALYRARRPFACATSIATAC